MKLLIYTIFSLLFFSQAATYTWISNSDTDWNNTANWDVNGVGVYNVSVDGAASDTVIFDGSVMPTINIPTFNGSVQRTHSIFQFNSGGSYTIDYSSAFVDSRVYITTGTTLTVGDGIGTTGTSTGASVTLANYDFLIRHGVATSGIVVNSDGVLNLNGDFNSYNNSRVVNFTINGGSIIATGNFDNNTAGTHTTPKEFYGTVTFNGIGSSLTAAYGDQFADLAAVIADVDSRFSLGSGPAFSYTDNGSTFTIAVVPEPSSLALVIIGLGVTCLARRRKV